MLVGKVQVQTGSIDRAGNVLDPKALKRIRFSALTETARAGRTLVQREIRQELALSAAAVNGQISVKRPADDTRALIVSRKGVSMREYGARQTRAGVSVLIRKGKGREVIQGAFGPKIDKLGRAVFKREGDKRFPIRKLQGPTAVAVLAKQPGMLNRVSAQMADTLMKRIDSKLALALSGSNAFADR
jgi:hypothetical protein